MQYLKPYTYFVSSPGGTNNLLWGSLCFLSNSFIPFIGILVWMGYIVEVIRSLKQDPEIEDHPDFDINKFTHYLNLGIWPMVMNLILGLFMTFLLILVVGLGFALAVATKEPLIGIGVGVVLSLPLSLFMMILIWPMTLHTQLRGALEFGSALSFTSRFLKSVGGQVMISVLVHFFLAQCLGFLGILLCCVGIFPAQAMTSMAQEHYMVQLYRIYLEEGGEPITPFEEPEYRASQRKRDADDELEVED